MSFPQKPSNISIVEGLIITAHWFYVCGYSIYCVYIYIYYVIVLYAIYGCLIITIIITSIVIITIIIIIIITIIIINCKVITLLCCVHVYLELWEREGEIEAKSMG